jgi:hypothetical protein
VVVSQKSLVHVYPASQVVPSQHASSSDPHVVVPVSQNPSVHVYPVLHVVPLQHVSSSEPHVVVPVRQTPSVHVSPALHVVLLQHASSSVPHAGAVGAVQFHQGDEMAALPQQSSPLSVAQSLSVLHVCVQLPAAAQ